MSTSRALFQPNTDTPSPNRSPGTHSPAHNPYSMYNHGNHRQNHGMLNGGSSHQNYQSQMGLHKGYSNQSHAHQGHMNNQHQDHSGLGGHGGAFVNHQQNMSTGTLSNATPHFTPAHLQNGTPDNAVGLGRPPNAHWAEQMQEYHKVKSGGDKPHYYARTSSGNSRLPGSTPSSISQRTDSEEHGERRRVVPNDEPEEAGAWDALDLGGLGLRSMGHSIFRHYRDVKKLYFNHNKLPYLPTEIGTMRNLVALDLSFNQLHELPPEIGMLTNLKKLLVFENYLTDLPDEIGSLYQLEMLGIEGNPMRLEIKERLMEHGTRELVRFFREQAPGKHTSARKRRNDARDTDITPEPEAPNDREWRQVVADNDAEADKFSVLSWNTLCDRAATATMYGYAPSQALSWQHRQEIILDELKGRNADILTLQEVDIESYNEHFRPRLALLDYKGVFWPKSRSQTMGEKEAKTVDGCATFFKNTKFIQLDKKLVMYNRDAINRLDMKSAPDVYNRVMPKDHIAVVTFLENRQTGSRLVVVNTHLAWEGWNADVKVIQVALLMAQLSNLAEEYARWPACLDKEVYKYAAEDSLDGSDGVQLTPAPSIKYDDGLQIPMLVCGDFNSKKDSGVYELITKGSLSNSHEDLGVYNYGDFTKNGMQHPFSLKSAYGTIGELPFTNYTPDFREVIDYIWYSTGSLQVTGLLGEVDPEYMQRVPGFPNWHFPSDHLSLWVEFSVKGRKEPRKAVEADFGNGRSRQ